MIGFDPKRTSAADEVIGQCAMSAFGTKRTSESTELMSAIGGKADVVISERHVCF